MLDFGAFVWPSPFKSQTFKPFLRRGSPFVLDTHSLIFLYIIKLHIIFVRWNRGIKHLDIMLWYNFYVVNIFLWLNLKRFVWYCIMVLLNNLTLETIFILHSHQMHFVECLHETYRKIWYTKEAYASFELS